MYIFIYLSLSTYLYTYIHNKGILLSYKREWNNVTYSNMDVPRDYHTKQSKAEKDKYQMVSLTCGI